MMTTTTTTTTTMKNLGGRLDTPAVDESKETDTTGCQHSHADHNDDEEKENNHDESDDGESDNDNGDNLSSGGSHSGKSILTEYLAKVRETMVAVHGLTMMHSAHSLVTIIMMSMKMVTIISICMSMIVTNENRLDDAVGGGNLIKPMKGPSVSRI